MIQWFLKKVIGTKNTRMLKTLRPTVERINQLEVEYQKLSDDELRAKVNGWRNRLSLAKDPTEQAGILDG